MANIDKDTLDNLPANKAARAIQKALDAGYEPDGIEDVTSFKVTIRGGQAWVRWFNNDGDEVIQDIEHVIYDHDFARALWGDEPEYGIKRYGDGDVITRQDAGMFVPWQYHLQAMVIADDPIEYLGAHLDD